jgi:hypothetical protein
VCPPETAAAFLEARERGLDMHSAEGDILGSDVQLGELEDTINDTKASDSKRSNARREYAAVRSQRRQRQEELDGLVAAARARGFVE